MSIFGHDDLRIGAIVHYVMRAEDYLPGATRSGYEHRPAIVVDAPPAANPAAPYPVNLVVILAGPEDGRPPLPPAFASVPQYPSNTTWRAGVLYDGNNKPGTWHWPE